MTSHDMISTPEGLRRFAAEWLGVCVRMEDAVRWAFEASRHKERWETSAGPFAWVKNRILESGLLPFGGFDPCEESIVTAILHVGFLSLQETQEMLERLAHDPSSSRDSTARSRIVKTIQIHSVRPIDATASRVSGGGS